MRPVSIRLDVPNWAAAGEEFSARVEAQALGQDLPGGPLATVEVTPYRFVGDASKLFPSLQKGDTDSRQESTGQDFTLSFGEPGEHQVRASLGPFQTSRTLLVMSPMYYNFGFVNYGQREEVRLRLVWSGNGKSAADLFAGDRPARFPTDKRTSVYGGFLIWSPMVLWTRFGIPQGQRPLYEVAPLADELWVADADTGSPLATVTIPGLHPGLPYTLDVGSRSIETWPKR